MPIGSVIQKGKWIYVYDEKGHQLFDKLVGNKPCDGLVGYTSTTVSIRKGDWIFTYNEKGRQISSKLAK